MGVYTGTPRDWTTGENVTETMLDENIRDPLTALGAAWTPYTPTISGFSLGNGTVTGAYHRFGKGIVVGRCKLTFGSTSTAATNYIGFSIPVTAVSTDIMPGASGYVSDASSGLTYSAYARPVSTTAWGLFMMGGTNGQLANFTTTTPFTWTTSDVAMIGWQVEVA